MKTKKTEKKSIQEFKTLSKDELKKINGGNSSLGVIRSEYKGAKIDM